MEFLWPVTIKSALKVEFLQDRVEMGHNYSQVVGRGPEPIQRKFEVDIGPLNSLEALEVQEFLDFHADGSTFEWRDPDSGKLWSVRVAGYTRTHDSSVYRTITTTFEYARVYP